MMGRTATLIGLILGVAGLALQFYLTLTTSLAAGRGLLSTLVFFFSFFTILANIAVVATYAAALTGRPSFFASARVRAGVVVAITIVLITYATVLAQLWTPAGLFFIADTTLHYIVPAFYILWWLFIGRTGATTWSDIPYWLVFPVVYLAYVMARAPIAGEVPYPFLDVASKGVGSVAVSVLLMMALFLGISVVAVLADRWFSRMRAH